MKLSQQNAMKGNDTRFIEVQINFFYVLTDHVHLYSLIKWQSRVQEFSPALTIFSSAHLNSPQIDLEITYHQYHAFYKQQTKIYVATASL